MLTLAIVPTQVTLRGNVGSLDAPIAAQLFTFGPSWQGITERIMNGLKKSAKNWGSQWHMPSLPTGPTQVTKTGNVGSVDVFRAAHQFTFDRVMH